MKQNKQRDAQKSVDLKTAYDTFGSSAGAYGFLWDAGYAAASVQLEKAEAVLQRNARPALGGKEQQYAAQAYFAEKEKGER